MKARHAVLALILAGAVVAGCSKSSTGPSDPLVGAWHVTWVGVPNNTQVTPSPWTINVSKSGAVYTATYDSLTWAYVTVGGVIDTYSAHADSSQFTIRNDTLLLEAQDPHATPCRLYLVGVISGNSVPLGSAASNGVLCQPGSWEWSATKQ